MTFVPLLGYLPNNVGTFTVDESPWWVFDAYFNTRCSYLLQFFCDRRTKLMKKNRKYSKMKTNCFQTNSLV